MENVDVIVVGAGAAGLAAARHLLGAGMNVLLLEARSRVGGRLWAQDIEGAAVDLGSAIVHGSERNPLSELVAELGLETVDVDYDNVVAYDSDGVALDGEALEDLHQAYQELLEDAAEAAEVLEEDASMETLLQELLTDEELDDDDERALSWCIASQELEAGANFDELGVFGMGERDDFEGEDLHIVASMGAIANGVARDMDVRLNHHVTRIAHDAQSVTVSCSNGEAFCAKAAIVTLPPGVLRAGDVDFVPELPVTKQDALNQLGIGIINRVALRFSEAFWPEDTDFFGFMGERHGRFPEWLNLASYSGCPVLVASCGGRYARAMEQMSDHDIVEDLMQVLRTMFGDTVPPPTSVEISRWGSDPFARGSICYLPPHASFDIRDRLAAPVEERLRFAGDATHSIYPSTVHGAWLSGIREAQALIKTIKP